MPHPLLNDELVDTRRGQRSGITKPRPYSPILSYDFGCCLEYEIHVTRDLERAAKCYRLAAECGSLGQSNVALADNHDERSALQGDPDSATNSASALSSVAVLFSNWRPNITDLRLTTAMRKHDGIAGAVLDCLAAGESFLLLDSSQRACIFDFPPVI
jgi:TPR repeat protein